MSMDNEDRRGQQLMKRCWFCGKLPTKWGVKCILVKAKISTLAYLDTRIISLMSGFINLVWSLFVFMPFLFTKNDPEGFLGRVVWSVPMSLIVPLIFALACCEIVSSVTNSYRGRMFCSFLSMIWWLWLTTMAFVAPPNESAGWMFAVITFFRGWTFITINRTHPEGTGHGRPV